MINKELIAQLADQAGADIWGDKVAASQYFDIEKFAELIVRECIDIAEQTRYDGKVVAERIKFVFGVEQ